MEDVPPGATKLPPIVLKEVYEQRFSREDQAGKEAIWHELGRFLQRYIKPEARVVDIACDLGYFIRNIHATERWATDIRDVSGSLPKDVRRSPQTTQPQVHSFGTLPGVNNIERAIFWTGATHTRAATARGLGEMV